MGLLSDVAPRPGGLLAKYAANGLPILRNQPSVGRQQLAAILGGFSGLGGRPEGSVMEPGQIEARQAYDAAEGAGLLSNLIPAKAMAASIAPLVGYLGMTARSGAKSVPSMMRQSGAILSMDEASRAKRMADMGMERGWFRGGKAPVDGGRTGPMYTQSREEAEGYAKRFGDDADVREYAIPTGGYLNAESSYSSKLAHDLATLLERPYYDKPGKQLAKELRTFGPDERISGAAVWQALESRFGNDGAAEVLQALGKFSGAKGFSAPGEAYVFKGAPVRDAERAKFDPKKIMKDDIYGRATLPGMAGSLGLGLLGLEAARRNQGGE